MNEKSIEFVDLTTEVVPGDEEAKDARLEELMKLAESATGADGPIQNQWEAYHR